jgi:small neutral amino acid transporter SnatA (MarC family)
VWAPSLASDFPNSGIRLFFIASALTLARFSRLSDEQLSANIRASERRIGSIAPLARAPLGTLITTGFLTLASLCLLVDERTDSRALVLAALAFSVGTVIALCLTFLAAYRGRPRFLVHPRLRGPLGTDVP